MKTVNFKSNQRLRENSRTLRRATTLLALFLVSIGQMWGTVATATAFTTSQSGTTYTVSAKTGTFGGCTVTAIGSSGGVTSNRLKVPAGTLNITAPTNMVLVRVEISWRNSKSQYPTSDSECTASVGSISTSSTTSTWTGSANAVSFTNTTTNTFQVIGLTIHFAYPVTHTLTNVSKGTVKDTASTAANFMGTYTAGDGYSLPENIGVSIGGNAKTQGTDFTWAPATGTITIPKANITGAIVVTIAGEAAGDPSCAATTPGNISKGTASGGTGSITLTAAGSPETGDTWYWQTAEEGEDKTNSGTTFDVSAASTYYIRSYNTSADCWSSAKSVTVTAADLLTAISPSLSYASTVIVGNTLSPTLTGNTGSGTVTYALNDVTPAGSLTINSSTGVVTAVTAGGTATVTATIAANGNYAGNTATSGTITVQRDPIGSGHTLTWEITTVSGSSESDVTGTTDIGTGLKTPTSSYLTSMTDLTGVGVNRTTSGKNSNTGKIETPSSYDGSKYVTMTFAVASGYQFTPSSVSIKTVAVSTTKDLKFEISDANGSYSVTKTGLSTSATAATNTLDFSSCDRAFTGTVTVKIYVYGANDTYRLSSPIIITGTVEAIPSGYRITKGSASNGSFTVTDGSSPITSADGGATVYIAATPNTGYQFNTWSIYKTDDAETTVTPAAAIASTSFTMPAYAVTVVPTFTAKTYTVTLNADGYTTNVDPTSVTATYNSSAIASITNPEKTGYTFGGWYSAAGGEGDIIINTAGALQAGKTGYTGAGGIWTKDDDATLYAQWTQTVTLDKNGGTANGSATATYNATSTTTPSAPTYSGHTVEGYYAEAGCTNLVLSTAGALTNYTGYVEGGKWVHAGATTLYAKWKVDAPTISYNSSTSTVTISVPTGSTVYYTDDGSTPTSGSTAYSAPFTIVATKTIKAIAIQSGCTSSDVASETCTYVPHYSVTNTLSHVSLKSGTIGTNAAVSGENYDLVFSSEAGYVLPTTIIVTIGGETATVDEDYTWNNSTGALRILAASVTGNIAISITASEDPTRYSVTYTKPTGAKGTAPTDETEYKYNQEVTVKANTDIADGTKVFRGWTDGTYFYQAGDKFNINANTTLTAVLSSSSTPDNTLFYTDFGDSDWDDITTICNSKNASNEEINGITFHSYNSSATPFTVDNSAGTLTWCNNNMGNNYWIAIPVTGVNGRITITVDNGSTATRFKYVLKRGTTVAGSPGSGTASSSADPSTVTIDTCKVSDYVVYLGRQGSGSTTLTSITITTPGVKTNYNVTFADGTTTPAAHTTWPDDIAGVPSGTKVLQPSAPTAAGYVFDGWYPTAACNTAAFDFSGTITKDITIYAKWIELETPAAVTVSAVADCSTLTADITLESSQSGVTFDLLNSESESQGTKVGNGSDLTWSGLAADTYTLVSVEDAIYKGVTLKEITVEEIATTSISTEPTPSVDALANVAFTLGSGMVVAGSGIEYQWYSYTNAGGDGEAAVSGETSATLTATKTVAGAYYYKVKVSGTCGDPVYSNMITVTVASSKQLSYATNGGSGSFTGGYYAANASVTIPSTLPTKTDNVFLGWNTAADGSGTMYQPGETVTMSADMTLTAQWATPNFKFKAGTTRNEQPVAGAEITTDTWSEGNPVLTGGSMYNTSSGVLGVNQTANYGLVMIKDTREVTVNLASGMFQAGTIIELTGMTYKESGEKTYGFSIGENAVTPLKTVTNANTAFTQRYVVAEDDGVEGTSSCTITFNGNGTQAYLWAINIAGCASCTPLSSLVLTYDNTTLYALGGTPSTATATLTGNTGDGAVSYSSSNPGVVSVNASTGAIEAVGAGTATITALVAAVGDYCGGSATRTITVPSLVQQTINLNSAWTTVPNMTFPGDPTSTLTKNTNITAVGYTIDESDNKSGLSSLISSTSEKTDANYLSLKFNSLSYNVRMGEVIVPIQPKSNNGTAQVEVWQGDTKLMTSNVITDIKAGTKTTEKFTFASEKTIPAGVIEIRIFFYGQTDGFRLASPILVNGGVVTSAYTPAAEGVGVSNLWSDPANWDWGVAPTINNDVVINREFYVDVKNATAKSVTLTGDAQLIINAGMALTVAGNVTKDGSQTSVGDVVLRSTKAAGTGALIMNPATVTVAPKATVEQATKTGKIGSDWINQHVGTPFSDGNSYNNWYGSYVYYYYAAGGSWVNVKRNTPEASLVPFRGYNVLRSDETTFWMQGTVNRPITDDVELSAVKNGGETKTENMFANSWLAPIDITAFENEDFVNIDKVIYIFNAGTPAQYAALSESGTTSVDGGTAAAQWMAMPIDAVKDDPSSFTYTVIPSMQGFKVLANAAEAKLKLNYDKLVYQPALDLLDAGEDLPIKPNLAPEMRHSTDDKPEVLALNVRGESGYGDRVLLFVRDDFSTGYDDGWEGSKMTGMSIAPQMYAVSEAGNMSIDAVPEAEGTVIGFRAGQDNNYTFTFRYEGNDVLYLNDMLTETSTRIHEGFSYDFTTADGDIETRFVISHTPFVKTTPTGMDNVQGDEGQSVRKLFYQGVMYIIRGGKIYNASGERVK